MFVLGMKDWIWIGGYEKYSNQTEYWIDDTRVDVDQLQVDKLDSHTHLLLRACNKWHLADLDPHYAESVLCEI